MRDFLKKRKRCFDINKPDFYTAIKERNFDDMADIYNEMMRYENDSRYGDNKYFFTEILEGNLIDIPLIPGSIIRSFGKSFYCILKQESVEFELIRNFDDDEYEKLTFDYLQSECIEIKRVELTGNSIILTDKAVKQLELSVGNIIIITIFNESFIIEKFEKPYIFE